MPSYTLELEIFGIYSSDIPQFEIWAEGALDSTHNALSSGSTISVTITYGGALPSSLEFRFNDALPEGGRTIEIRSVKINDKYVNTGNYLSSDSLTNGGAAGVVDVADSDFIFEPSVDMSEFSGATSLTAGNDFYYNHLNTALVIDALGGNDSIIVGAGDDNINGGAGNDYITVGAGADYVFGDTGNDTIWAGDGNDTVFAGDDDDRAYGGAGDDEIHGGAGNDKLSGQAGDDEITGGDGDDKITGGSGTNHLYGDAGDDRIMGGSGIDTIDGGADNDILFGGGNNDIIDGGDGDDRLYGGNGDDTLNGNDGNDIVYGMNGDDTLYGSDGQDNLYGNAGADTLDGGAGNDSLIGGDGIDTLNGGDGDDILSGDLATYNYSSGLLVLEAENFSSNVEKSDHVWEVVTDAAASGNSAVYVDNNGAGDFWNTQTLAENSSPELNYTVNFSSTGTYYVWVRGDAPNGGDDSVHIGFNGVRQTDDGGVTGFTGGYNWGGASTYGGTRVTLNVTTTGDHTLNLWAREDGVTVDKLLITDDIAYTPTGLGPLESVQNSASGGVDTINGGAGDDVIQGDVGDDILSGGDDDDLIYGGADNDTVNGDAGNDTLLGNSGEDTLNGGAGDDTIYSSDSTTQTDVADILAANAGVVYNASTGNFYQFVAGNGTTNFTWAQANTAANAATLTGSAATGHLVTITSADEHNTVDGILTDTSGAVRDVAWTAGADTGTEGVWQWMAGPEAGTTFWNGGATGEYTNWYLGTPQNNSAANDHMLLLYDAFNSQWYVFDGTSTINTSFPPGYIVEWEGSDVLGTSGTNTISGGDGSDTLYGTDAVQDIFTFMSGETGTDTIENFTAADDDAIDISDLLTGYTAGVSDINDFVQFTNSGADTLIQVDANGTTGGVSFTTIGQINGVNDLDADALLYNGSIIA